MAAGDGPGGGKVPGRDDPTGAEDSREDGRLPRAGLMAVSHPITPLDGRFVRVAGKYGPLGWSVQV